jgi:hypothetical protein
MDGCLQVGDKSAGAAKGEAAVANAIAAARFAAGALNRGVCGKEVGSGGQRQDDGGDAMHCCACG